MSLVYKSEEEFLGAEIEELLCTLAWKSNAGHPDYQEMFSSLEGLWKITQHYTFGSLFRKIDNKRDTKIILQRATNSIRPIDAPVVAEEAAFDREQGRSTSSAGADATVAAFVSAMCEVVHTSTPDDEVERTRQCFETLLTRMVEFSARMRRMMAGEEEEDAPILSETKHASTINDETEDASVELEVEHTSATDNSR